MDMKMTDENRTELTLKFYAKNLSVKTSKKGKNCKLNENLKLIWYNSYEIYVQKTAKRNEKKYFEAKLSQNASL